MCELCVKEANGRKRNGREREMVKWRGKGGLCSFSRCTSSKAWFIYSSCYYIGNVGPLCNWVQLQLCGRHDNLSPFLLLPVKEPAQIVPNFSGGYFFLKEAVHSLLTSKWTPEKSSVWAFPCARMPFLKLNSKHCKSGAFAPLESAALVHLRWSISGKFLTGKLNPLVRIHCRSTPQP